MILAKQVGQLFRYLDKCPKALLTCAGVLLTLGVGVLDYFTGRELSIAILYLVPVTFTTWHAGRSFGVAIAILSAAVWLVADLEANPAYGHPFVPYWNALVLLFSFLLVVFLLWSLRDSRDRLEELVEGRTAALKKEIAERKRAETSLIQVNTELDQSRVEVVQALKDLQKSHEELKATQLQLIEAAKLESVGRLAAGVAHEVKNPLMTIAMGTDYLGQVVSSKEGDVATALKDIKDAVVRARSVIAGLLDFAAPSRLQAKPENLNGLVERSLDLVKHALVEGRVSLVKELAQELPLLRLDQNRIKQVLVNVFMNAIQAMPQGGTLTVRTYAAASRMSADLSRGAPPGSAVAKDPWVALEADDTGAGIPPQNLAKVFDPFFTTKQPREGTGLGLSVARQIITLHGGTITLSNRAQGGARVTILLKSNTNQSL